MDHNSTEGNYKSELIQRKSLLIIQAQFQQAMGQHLEATRLFLDAALLEEKLADSFYQAGRPEDAAISFFSAASCYKQAGRAAAAIGCANQAMSCTKIASLTEEIRQFLDDCQPPPSPTSPRTLRGIVRNGAVYPFEPGILTDGEWVTITTT